MAYSRFGAAQYRHRALGAISLISLVVLATCIASPSRLDAQAAQSMTTQFATPKDGIRIAYDVTGSGPALILLHGGGQTRRVWRESSYVGRLQDEFKVITVDLRGHGESDKPTNVEAYGFERLTDDILVVADAARVRRFAVWGYSFGGNIARYLPARSDRVDKLVIMGIPFGPAAPPSVRDVILGLRSKWAPIVEAGRAGTLNVGALSAEDRAVWESGTPLGAVPVTLAWLSAMLDWPSLEPASVPCPTLWLVGTANEDAMSSVSEYAPVLERTKVTLQLVSGLTHERELTEVEEVLPPMLKFTRSP